MAEDGEEVKKNKEGRYRKEKSKVTVREVEGTKGGRHRRQEEMNAKRREKTADSESI